MTVTVSLLISEFQVLILTGGSIAVLPDDVFSVANLLNLQEVALNDCGLRTVAAFAFRDLSNLASGHRGRQRRRQKRPNSSPLGEKKREKLLR